MCPFKGCTKTFYEKTNWLCHQKVHDGEKEHSCESCDKKFTRKDQLIIHQESHVIEK